MGSQDGKVSDSAAPPFATKSGQSAPMGSGAGGGHDFVKDNESHSPKTGGRDFNKEHRPQAQYAKPEVAPNPQEIPAGGKDLKADPSGSSAQYPSGGVQGVAKTPFKNLK